MLPMQIVPCVEAHQNKVVSYQPNCCVEWIQCPWHPTTSSSSAYCWPPIMSLRATTSKILQLIIMYCSPTDGHWYSHYSVTGIRINPILGKEYCDHRTNVHWCQNWDDYTTCKIFKYALCIMIIQIMRHLPTLGFPNVKALLSVSAPSPLLPSQQNMQPPGTKCFWFISSALLQQTCRQCSTMFETESAIIRVGALFLSLLFGFANKIWLIYRLGPLWQEGTVSEYCTHHPEHCQTPLTCLYSSE